LDLQLPLQSVPMATKVVSSNSKKIVREVNLKEEIQIYITILCFRVEEVKMGVWC
jgi:hypothetical protein